MVGPTKSRLIHSKTDVCGEVIVNAIRWFLQEEEGASAAEYAVLLVVITLGIVGALTLLDANITTAISNAAGLLVGS